MKLNESLYSKYLKEKDGIDTLETDKGLVTFIQQGKNGEEFYIVDIYVLPQYRRTGYATYLGKDSKTYSDSRAALESFGFRFAIFIEEDRIDYFKKEL
jgi:GNAT superfamily N-acetyltransferase